MSRPLHEKSRARVALSSTLAPVGGEYGGGLNITKAKYAFVILPQYKNDL